MNAEDNKPMEYQGRTYTKYEALQRQRKLETSIRAMREQIHLLEVAEVPEDDIINARCRYQGSLQEYNRFSKAMGLPVQRDRIYVDGWGNIGVGKTKKPVDKSAESGIMKLNRSINRKEKNIGAFSNLEISMHKKSVMQICKKYSIDTKGLTLKIQRSEKMLSMPFYGSTDYDNIGRIDLFPNAFINEEQLVRTIIHEKCHVLQLQKYGKNTRKRI